MVLRPAATAIVAGVLALGLAGCSEDASTATPTPAPGPADAYLDAALDFSADDAAQGALRMEELVATCMHEQGFDYVPDVSTYHVVDLTQLDPPPGTQGFAEQYGYGYATAPDVTKSTAGPGANDEITSRMSAEELEAYTTALWGDQGDAAGGEAEVGGCFGAARTEVWGDRATDPVRAALEDEIARIDAEVAPADPAVVESASTWADCMADAGYPDFATPTDAEQAAWDSWTEFNDAIAADPSRGEVGPDGQVAGQAEVGEQEVALATADWHCRAESDYDAVWRATRDRLQQEYVDAHRDDLDTWVASRG